MSFWGDQLGKQRKSLFLWCPVAMGAGIVAYFYSNEVTWSAIGGAAFLLLLSFWKMWNGYRIHGTTAWLVVLYTTMALGLFITGYGLAKYRTDAIATPIIEKDLPPLKIEGVIEKIVLLEGDKAKRVILKNVFVPGREGVYRVRLKSYHFKGEEWQIGDRVSVKAKLMAPSGPVIPGGFDFRFKAYYEGLSAVGYTLGDAEIISKNKSSEPYLTHLRRVIGSSAYQSMDPRYAGIAQALLTGERAGIIEEDAESLRVSGLAHLLAISGLHIGLVAGCVFFFVRLGLVLIPGWGLRYPIKKWAAAAAILFAFAYMIIAGATVPTVRAFIMTSLVLTAIMLDRSALSMRLVALAAMVVMIMTPEAIMGPSFVLSFAAVAGLIAFYQDYGRRWFVNANAYRPLMRPFYYVFGVIVTSIVATLVTAPFSVMFFNRFALYSVLSNILAMPLMAFVVMPFGLLSLLLIPFGLDPTVWPIVEWGIATVMHVSDAVASYAYASLYIPSFSDVASTCAVIGFIWLVLCQGGLRWIGVIMIALAFAITLINQPTKILIAEDMSAILYVDKSEDKLYLKGKMNGYTKQNWLGALGYSPDVDIIKLNAVDNIDLSNGYCDDFMCRFNIGEIYITLLGNVMMLPKACQNTQILIAPFPVKDRQCPNVDVIDRFDVWRHGAMMITFTNSDYTIDMVRP